MDYQLVALALFVDHLAYALERQQLLSKPRHVGPELLDRSVRTPRRQRHVFRGEKLIWIAQKKRKQLPFSLRHGNGGLRILDCPVLGVKDEASYLDLGRNRHHRIDVGPAQLRLDSADQGVWDERLGQNLARARLKGFKRISSIARRLVQQDKGGPGRIPQFAQEPGGYARLGAHAEDNQSEPG